MKHFWLGVALLVLFFALGIWVSVVMDDVHTEISQTLDQAAQATLSGELEQGISLARQAKIAWEKNWRGTAAVADHSPMDEIDSLFSEMEVYAKTREEPHFAACCTQLSKLVLAVGEAHSLNWWNFL